MKVEEAIRLQLSFDRCSGGADSVNHQYCLLVDTRSSINHPSLYSEQLQLLRIFPEINLPSIKKNDFSM